VQSRDTSTIFNLYMGLFDLHKTLASFVSLLRILTEFFSDSSEFSKTSRKLLDRI
jgi:hypothetical protein